MKVQAARLLAVLLVGVLSSDVLALRTPSPEDTAKDSGKILSTYEIHNPTKSQAYSTLPSREDGVTQKNADDVSPVNLPVKSKVTTSVPEKVTPRKKFSDPLFDAHAKPVLNPKDMLLQEIHTLDEEATNERMQDEVAKTFKAEAQKFMQELPSTPAPEMPKISNLENETTDSTMQRLFGGEDLPYDDELSDEEDEEDEDDEEYDDDDNEDELDDEEEVMTQCPDYCKCSGQYASATTATCTKLVDEQSFGTGIAHLRIENAGEIRLGPHALRSRGLQQLESITIVDTRIVELNQSAFHGIAYLFAVNLTRNGLQEIHPNTFRNNTQLSLLTVSGNPLKHTQDPGKHILFDAPSVTEFDFSNNGLTRLKPLAFSRMQSLVYVNLKGNRLREIDGMIFDPLESLVEVDLSNNLLNEIPVDLFYNKAVQTIRVAGNNLSTLATIRASKLTVLDASNNKIKIITKDDLAGVPLLDQLTVSMNGIKRIHQHAFTDLDQLTYLDVSGNKLNSWTEHHLRTNSRLQVLLMNDNPGLATLPVFKTSGLEYETYNIYRFECANCGLSSLKEGTFGAMPALTRLNLARNRLTGLPNGLLARLSSLRTLDLSDNIIDSLSENMFGGAKSLTRLSLAGNPLTTLQVTPFLTAPGLTRLDVSRCTLERVWSEARVPLNNLRFLSVRENLLRRITVEELRATPKISGLDLSHNPLECDDEFNESVQWLTDHGVKPTETLRYASHYGNGDDYPESEGISEWTDLAKVVCDGVNDGPPVRPVPHKEKKIKQILAGLGPEETDPLSRADFDDEEEMLKMNFDHGLRPDEEVEKAWTSQDLEYKDFTTLNISGWNDEAIWSVVVVIVVTLLVLLMAVHVAVQLARRRGRGPVIRPPMILRQGFIDNKNCGLVYKPLQEEIATPHMPKRGSFYSSSTFHYDKIVPESV